MTPATHTPGPWKPYLIDNGTAKVLTVGRGFGVICTLDGDGAHFQPKPNHHANAQLIASAPALLAALKAALIGLYGAVGTEDIQRQAREAINQAEGQKGSTP